MKDKPLSAISATLPATIPISGWPTAAPITGAAVSLLIITIGIIMIVRGNIKLKNIQGENLNGK